MGIQGVGQNFTLQPLRPAGFASAVLGMRLDAPPPGEIVKALQRPLPPPEQAQRGFSRAFSAPPEAASGEEISLAFAADGELPGTDELPAALRTAPSGTWRRLFSPQPAASPFAAPDIVLESGFSSGLPPLDSAPILLAEMDSLPEEIDLRGQLWNGAAKASDTTSSLPSLVAAMPRIDGDGHTIHGRGGVHISAAGFNQLLVLLGASAG